MNDTPFSTHYVTPTTPAGRPRSDRDQPQPDAGRRLPAQHDRALVLGGGGSVGNAWLIGVLAGLSEAGLDPTGADLVIGTSAGATAAAQVTGSSPTRQLAAILDAVPPPRPDPVGPGPVGSNRGRVVGGAVSDQLRRTSEIIAAAADPADGRRRLGAAALELAAASGGDWQARWRTTVAARLPSQDWPDRTVLITAVDAHDGEPVVFDRHSGVPLVDAVAASTSSGPAYEIGGRRYIDGGYRRSSENADLAAGCGRVLVLSPFGGRSRYPVTWRMHLAAQVDELSAAGSRVATVFPGEDIGQLLAANAMDLSLRPVAARAGADQGRALAEELTGFWR
jgi:NTE family protein